MNSKLPAHVFDLANALKQLPDQPGVYRMYDAHDTLIYVGKAKVLKNRVRSYFVGSHTMKVAVMVNQIARFDFIITQSEVEALVLEANLIKANMPKYNILLRDDKKYPWIALSDEPFQRLYVTRNPEKRGKTKYFGPYISSGDLYTTLQAIKRHFPLRQRRKPLFKTRPCMNYFIGTCLGPCQQKVTPEAYNELVNRVELFLKGKGDELKKILQAEMQTAASAFNFEHAGKLRDTISAVDTVTARQRVVYPDHRMNQDVMTQVLDARRSIIVVMSIRHGKLIASRTHRLQVLGEDDKPESALSAFIFKYYDALDAADLPDELVLPFHLGEEEEMETLSAWLSQKAEHTINLTVPQKGQKKDLLVLADRNAQDALKQAAMEELSSIQHDSAGVLMELQEILNLPDFPSRIECYDISHFQGSQTVASMVVFTDAKPDKQAYRRFKIQCAEGKPDDFASMNEVIRRRFTHSGEEEGAWPDPDLLIIDGGKGQLGAAIDALTTHGITDQPIVSLAKKFEEVFVPGESRPVVIARDSKVLLLLQQIRDEAHRFAITYHRQLRGKAATTSAMAEVKGLGEANKRKLLAHFGSVSSIQKQTAETIAACLDISPKRAASLLKQLNS